MAYTVEHADALADVVAAGVAVSFVRAEQTVDAATNEPTGFTSTSVAGAAFRKKGDPVAYAKLGLVLASSVTLFFVPTVGTLRADTSEFVMVGDSITWNGAPFTVKLILDVVAPDGYVICANVVCA